VKKPAEGQENSRLRLQALVASRTVRIASVAAAALGIGVALAVSGSDGGGSEARSVRPAELAPPASPARGPKNPPVVFLLLDEFPADMLLGRGGRIDPVRYPNFARLAREGYWFPNATTVFDSTSKSTPAILDGLLPRDGTKAVTADHPHSLYTMLGRRGYRIVNSEEATRVCPDRYCPGNSTRNMKVLRNLSRGREERLNSWIGKVRARKRTLYFKHALLPHVPWIFLPSGRQHRLQARDPVPGLASPRGFHDPDLTKVNMLRHQLQVGYTDRQLGRLIAQMESAGIWKRALVVVTADHGYAWELGVATRRRTSASNVAQMAPVPLFIKAPGQRRGRTVRSYVRTVDIVPTIADLLNIRPGYDVDGSSAFSRTVRRRRRVRVIDRDFNGVVAISARAIERRRSRFVRRKLRMFGVGPERGPDVALFRGIGPHRELLGRSPSELAVAARSSARASLAEAGALANVDLSSELRPVHIAGTIAGGGREKRDIAVAVNGSIEAVGRSFFLKGSTPETFSVVVPEWTLRQGRNDVRVFEVGGQAGNLRLVSLS
jgi:Sulfatase